MKWPHYISKSICRFYVYTDMYIYTHTVACYLIHISISFNTRPDINHITVYSSLPLIKWYVFFNVVWLYNTGMYKVCRAMKKTASITDGYAHPLTTHSLYPLTVPTHCTHYWGEGGRGWRNLLLSDIWTQIITIAYNIYFIWCKWQCTIWLMLFARQLMPGYLTVHDYQVQDTSLYMTIRSRISHCTWLSGPGYFTVHDYLDQISHCTWLPGPGYFTVHDYLDQISHCTWLPGPGCLTVHDYLDQDASLYMTTWTRILHCTWLPGPGCLTVHDYLD